MTTSGVRIVVLNDYQGIAPTAVDWAARLPGADLVFHEDHASNDAELVSRLRGVEIVVSMRERTQFGRTLLSALPSLRLIVTSGRRNAAIDLAAAAEAGVIVSTSQGGNEWAPVEHTWALILALAKHVREQDAAVRAGHWQAPSVNTSLFGKTLGVIGLGKLGSRVATIGRAFNMRVIAWSPNLTQERAAHLGVTAVSKPELLDTADVVSIHVVLNDATRGLIGEPELRAMRPSSYLVNTSRGPIVDEPTLVRALREGWIAGAGIDVFDREPLPPDHPLRSTGRTVLSPHLGHVTDDYYRAFYGDVIENIEAYLAGRPIRVLS